MRAAVVYGTEDVRVEDVEVKEVLPNQAKVEVEWAGICGSDLHIYTHFEAGLVPIDAPHPLSGQKAPLTMGHEFAGIVREVGAEVTNVKVGDRVTVEPIYYCGKCRECMEGNYQVCRNSNAAFVGIVSDGGFAEFCVTEADKLHILPDNVTMEEGALVEPTAVAYHGIIESGLQVGQTVLITGAGPIGLLTAQCALAAGATKIFVSDVSEERLAIAKKMGATHVLNPTKVDVVATVLAETNGDGVDVTFEAAGVQATLNTAVSATKRKGCVLILALFMAPVEISMFEALVKELTIKPTLAYANEFPQVIDMMATKRINVEQVITNRTQLEQIVPDGIRKLLDDKSEAKILVKMK